MSQVKKLKVTTLGDSLVYHGGHGQSGLSLLLELVDAKDEPRKVLFDTGDDKDALMHNVKLSKLELGSIDAVVLSHGHLDHTAATVEIVAAAGGTKVFAHPRTFVKRFVKRKGKRNINIGVPEGQGIAEIEKAGGKVALSAKPAEVVSGLWTTGEIERKTFETVIELPGGGELIAEVDGKEIADAIPDDLALWMDVRGVGPFVVTGCAHSGPINTLEHVKRSGSFGHIHGLVGGTHMLWRSDDYVRRTIDEMKRFGLDLISPCHCTGWKAATRFWQAFPGEFVLNYCFRAIEAGKKTEEPVW